MYYLLAENTVPIQRPALAVFEYVSNMENFAEWFPGVVAIQSSNAMHHGQPGKQYRETVSVPLRGTRQITLEVREVRGPLFFATEGRFAPLMPRMELSLQETDAHSCQFTYRVFSRNGQPVVKYLLHPLARRVMGKRAAVGVGALKQRLEQAGRQ